MRSPKTLLMARDIRPRQTLGQNFLCDPQTAAAIVRHGNIRPDDTVVEIGAGTGALTVPAARAAARVFAIETDGRLIDLLTDTLQKNRLENVSIHHNDFMDIDLADFYSKTGQRLIVMGNLPYYLSSQILVRLVQERRYIKRAVLMFQQELADRIAAGPGSRKYGRLSVMLRYCADIKPLMRIKKELFYPKPKVTSAVVSIDFKGFTGAGDCEENLLFEIIKIAFAQRRKTIKNALTAGKPDIPQGMWKAVLEKAGINPGSRAEALDASDYIDICKYYKALTTETHKKVKRP